MKEKVQEFVNRFGLPRIIIMLFLLFLCILMVVLKLPVNMIISQTLVRIGMNGILVLAMVPGGLCRELV